MSLYTVKSVLVLDSEGKRVCAKYYSKDLPTYKEQTAFEKNLWTKTNRSNAEILLWENVVAVYRTSGDVIFYTTGSYDENELVLLSVLNAFYDAVSKLLRGQVDKLAMLDNLDSVLLALDELIDDGIVLESDPSLIAQRATMKFEDVPLSEQTISQAMGNIKEQLARSLLK
eukprot:TRINITY_DN9085_c0_g1_i1.p1 TRINITY_DN9085_c0_g1~~TRINITY_DN9085_c0_g1_i1.p1  ORF type:complete len:171 (-),score=61.61 TRINITY_DN9085_c0_g1_i1:205-717(-)